MTYDTHEHIRKLKAVICRQHDCEEIIMSERDQARAERDRCLDLLRELQWCITYKNACGVVYKECPVCKLMQHEGHSQGCLLATLLDPKKGR